MERDGRSGESKESEHHRQSGVRRGERRKRVRVLRGRPAAGLRRAAAGTCGYLLARAAAQQLRRAVRRHFLAHRADAIAEQDRARVLLFERAGQRRRADPVHAALGLARALPLRGAAARGVHQREHEQHRERSPHDNLTLEMKSRLSQYFLFFGV